MRNAAAAAAAEAGSGRGGGTVAVGFGVALILICSKGCMTNGVLSVRLKIQFLIS